MKTALCYRIIETQARRQMIIAANPIPADLRQALDAISRASGGMQKSGPARDASKRR